MRGPPKETLMRSLGRWCVRHRFAVLGMWLVVLVATFVVQSIVGSNYATSTTLSGTPSAAAASLLQRAVPSESGDTEQIVFEARAGTITAPVVETKIQAVLAQVAHLPAVSGVTSPYSTEGANQVSENKQVAFATVNFTKNSNEISAA